MDDRSVTKGMMPDLDKYGSVCGGNARTLKKIVCEKGFLYMFASGRLRISVFDEDGCFSGDVQDMIDGRNNRSTGCFTGWFAKEGLKKFVPSLIPPEYYIAAEFKPCDVRDLTVPKETPMPYEEMSAANVYNYPNPCNGHTAIRFSVPESRKTDILITDITGRPVWQKHLDAYKVIPGVNYLLWDGINDRGVEAANGTYILRVVSGEKVISKKIVIIR
jgi:hypothetical protein